MSLAQDLRPESLLHRPVPNTTSAMTNRQELNQDTTQIAQHAHNQRAQSNLSTHMQMSNGFLFGAPTRGSAPHRNSSCTSVVFLNEQHHARKVFPHCIDHSGALTQNTASVTMCMHNTSILPCLWPEYQHAPPLAAECTGVLAEEEPENPTTT